VANIKSQIKRVKTNEKARLRNKSVSSSIKTAVRRFRDAVKSGDAAVITTELRTASQSIDVAVAKGVVHKNNAANKKSSMAKAAAKAGAR
jgi:small subunit ribosomal protein S20